MHFVSQKQAWRPMSGRRLGIDWGGLLTDVVGGGLDVWSGYQEQEAAEDIRKAAEIRAAAEREAAKAAAERAAEAEAAKIRETKAEGETVLGIDKDIALYGGLGLAALIGAFFILR